MYITKVKESRFCRVNAKTISTYIFLDTTKTKPLIKTDDIRLYKIFQKTDVILNKDDIIEAFTNFKGEVCKCWSDDKPRYSIETWNLVHYLRDKLGNAKIYSDRDADYTFGNHFVSRISPEELPDDYTLTIRMIFFNEDAKLIEKRTPKEQQLIKENIEIKDNLKIFKHFIKPVVQPICNEYGIEVTDNCLYFQDRKKLINFLKIALKEIIVKQFEKAGVTVSVPDEIGNPRSRELWPRETIFQAVDFRIMKEGDKNEENLG